MHARFPKSFLCSMVFLSIVFLNCNMEPENYTPEIRKMEDTLFKAFPSVNRVSIEVKRDFGSELIITLGDAELYNASEEKRQSVTSEAAAIAHQVFGSEKPLRKGKVIFVKEERTLETDASTHKVYDMPAEKLNHQK